MLSALPPPEYSDDERGYLENRQGGRDAHVEQVRVIDVTQVVGEVVQRASRFSVSPSKYRPWGEWPLWQSAQLIQGNTAADCLGRDREPFRLPSMTTVSKTAATAKSLQFRGLLNQRSENLTKRPSRVSFFEISRH